MTDLPMSVSCRYYVGIASVFFACAMTVTSAHAGGWEEFLKRCITPMETGGDPAVIGLEPVDEDPVGQAFDLPGDALIAIRPPYQEFGLQCVVTTKPAPVAKKGFDAWIAGAAADGRYTEDQLIESRWLTGEATAKPLAMDVWQEGDWMVFQLSFLEVKS